MEYIGMFFCWRPRPMMETCSAKNYKMYMRDKLFQISKCFSFWGLRFFIRATPGAIAKFCRHFQITAAPSYVATSFDGSFINPQRKKKTTYRTCIEWPFWYSLRLSKYWCHLSLSFDRKKMFGERDHFIVFQRIIETEENPKNSFDDIAGWRISHSPDKLVLSTMEDTTPTDRK